MPIFEFKCEECGESFERIIPYDSALALEGQACEQCGGKIVRMMPSRIGLKFIGRDFYINESRMEKSKAQVNENTRIAKERSDKVIAEKKSHDPR